MKNNKNNDNLISLQSTEFKPNQLKQMGRNDFQKSKGKGNELNALINELQEEEPPKPKRRLEPIVQIHHNETTMDHPKAQEKLVSHDSFEDLMGEFDPLEQEDKPPGMAKVEFINKQTNEDEFDF